MSIKRFKNKGGYDINVSPYLYKACESNYLRWERVVTSGGKRLDHYAYEKFNNSSYWWIIAACSGIGWSLQVPDGIALRIPVDIDQVKNVIGEI
jgi:hypothetical protein